MTNFPKNGHFLEIASNFHFLLFLMNNDFVKFAPNEVEQLAKAVKDKNNEAANEWAENNANWATLMELVSANEAQGGQYFYTLWVDKCDITVRDFCCNNYIVSI